ncbi:hypothetical protein [Streptomyces sp. NPDC002078]
MSIEPYGNRRQPALNDADLGLTGVPYKERKQLGREARAAIFREELRQFLDHLKLDHLVGLKRQQIQAHIALGRELEQGLQDNLDNPLITDALHRSWEAWKVESEIFIRQIAQRTF